MESKEVVIWLGVVLNVKNYSITQDFVINVVTKMKLK